MDSFLFKLHCEKGISVFLLCFKYKRLYQSTWEDTSSKDSKLVEQIFILTDKVPKTFSLIRITHENRHYLMVSQGGLVFSETQWLRRLLCCKLGQPLGIQWYLTSSLEH